jgi:hypothetical protein
MRYYKHPLYEKPIKKQITEGYEPLFIAKIKNQSYQISKLIQKKINLEKNRQKFKKVCNSILFIIYLRRYSRLYRSSRQKFMFELNIDSLKQ